MRKPRVMISSTIQGGFRNTLKRIEAALLGLGYEPIISDRPGRFPVDPTKTPFENCLDVVAQCDIFVGFIRGYYGSGVVGKDISITHQEIRAAVRLRKYRFIAVEHDVVVARQLLKQFRFFRSGPRRGMPRPHSFFKATPIISDSRVLEMYEDAAMLDQPYEKREGAWIQEVADDEEFLRYIVSQLANVDKVFKAAVAYNARP